MGAAPIPDNEDLRLAALHRYTLLDTVPEAEFDRVTHLAARLFDVPIALVSLVDADRQWFKSCVGLDASETNRDDAFCAHALFDVRPLIVPDAKLDVRFTYNPLVTGEPHIRFYAGAPLITPDGYTLGTLCIIDRKPRTLSPSEEETLVDLSRVVVDLVEARMGFRSREMFEKVTTLSPNSMYVFDLREQRHVFANPNLVNLLGFAPQDAGSQIMDTALHPDDAKLAPLHFARFATLADGESVDVTFRVLDFKGEWRILQARETVFERDVHGVPTKSLGIANDVTELRKLEALAKEKTLLLETVLSSAGEGILAADEHGTITVFNDAATRILGTDRIREPEERAAEYGVFEVDGVTRVDVSDLPLARSLRGEHTEGRELMVRSKAMPTGRFVLATGRPLAYEDNTRKGAVVTFRDITPLKKAQHALAELAVTDDLTGLPNKRALRERLEQLAREGGRGRKFAVVVTDVDYFKKVNDTYGHKTGDEVLQVVGNTLRCNVRATDFVARYGGEEFVVLYTDVDEDIATHLAEKLRLAIAGQQQPVAVTASFGVCGNIGPLAADPDALIKAADEALYVSKREGRNRITAVHRGQR